MVRHVGVRTCGVVFDYRAAGWKAEIMVLLFAKWAPHLVLTVDDDVLEDLPPLPWTVLGLARWG